MERKKIGILGGTFDPIHNGHIMIAKAAMNEYELSELIIMPTGKSYMKTDVTDSYLRMQMVKLAIQAEEKFVASDLEIKREGNTYTAETIAYFKKNKPEADIYFIMGTDSLFSIERWWHVQEIFDHCTILCASRNTIQTKEQEAKAEELREKFHAKIFFIHCDMLDVSSTEIREFRKKYPNKSVDTLEIPKAVAAFILKYDLYSEKTDHILALLKDDLKPKRFRHTIGVVDTAIKLAEVWGCNLEKARIAALLHDCAKYVDEESKRAICAKYGVAVREVELANTELLHAKAGALLAYEKYGVKDTEILSAIFYHTTGKPDMSLLEKIIFISDYIEPNRKHSAKLPFYRELAMKDIDKVTAMILKDTIQFLNSGKKNLGEIDPHTETTYDYYKKYL